MPCQFNGAGAYVSGQNCSSVPAKSYLSRHVQALEQGVNNVKFGRLLKLFRKLMFRILFALLQCKSIVVQCALLFYHSDHLLVLC